MERKLYYFFVLAILGFNFNIFSGYSQCTPDTTLKQPGIYPDILPKATPNVAYSAVLQTVVPTDTVVDYQGQQINATVDSVKVKDVIGLPPGFTYACNPSSCVYPGGTTGCFVIEGTPAMSDTGEYELLIIVEASGRDKQFGIQIVQSDTINQYVIIVSSASSVADRGISPVKTTLINDRLNIAFDVPQEDALIDIVSLNGEVLISERLMHASSKDLNLSNLSNGLYLLRFRSGNYQEVKKFVLFK